MATQTAGNVDLAKVDASTALEHLGTNVETGLTGRESADRLREYGRNEVLEQKTNPLLRFLKRFWGLTAWMLELIIVISWILRRFSDLAVVAALLVVNAIIGFLEEQRASGAVEALRRKLRVSARVLRDGAWSMVPATELVPGDIIRLRPGDFVPADVKVVTGGLAVDQSALTGESVTMERNADEVLYSGSVVRQGEASGVVILTGRATFYGRTTELVQIARPKLHMEDVVALLVIAVVASALKGVRLLEILPLVMVLLLSAVPVALPVMFTVSMAVGSMELARKGVLVTRLSASEDAATMDVLCVDKTGTITMNQLSVTSVVPLEGFTDGDVLLYGALASQEANQDPIDVAFPGAARKKDLALDAYRVAEFVPFDPTTRRTEALVRRGEREFRAIKGAVRSVGGACGLDAAAVQGLEAKTDALARKGHRVLAVARADGQGLPRLVGMVTLTDALRTNSKELIGALKELGVSVKMLTGDALPIARDIAQEAGLGGELSRMADIEEAGREDPALAASTAERSDGFAEIYPEGKYAVVKSLQARGHVVGMTGDGVNDAPALRQAEVGIAVSNAVDVAKGAASVVLTREGLSGVVDLVTNGRMVYERITTWVINKISRTVFKASFVVLVLLLDAAVAALLATVGMPGMKAVPFTTTLVVVAYSAVFSLFANDAAKYFMVRRLGAHW